MITESVVNTILHHVGMSWIICSNQEMLYEIEKSNHPNWSNKGTFYNTDICSKLHEKLFGDFITHAKTDRYNLMYSIVAHDKNNIHMKMKI